MGAFFDLIVYFNQCSFAINVLSLYSCSERYFINNVYAARQAK